MINNIPKYAENYKFIVACYSDGEYWFWGAFNEKIKAINVAQDIDGKVFTNIF